MQIVLGRFQPFHKGHAYLVEAALEKGPTVIAIGSSQAESSMDNPWSADEREEIMSSVEMEDEQDTEGMEDVQVPKMNSVTPSESWALNGTAN